MEDNIWLRLITVGLVLTALAVGYFLLSGRLTSNSANKIKSQTNQAVSSPTPIPTVLGQNNQVSPSSTPVSAYTRIAERSQGNIQTLPNTGFPVFLALSFSVSAIISGWGLRKFPH